MNPTESGEDLSDKKCLLGELGDKKTKEVNYEGWWSRTKDWVKKIGEKEGEPRGKAVKYKRLQ